MSPKPPVARNSSDVPAGSSTDAIGALLPLAVVANSRIEPDAGVVPLAAVFCNTYTPTPGAPVVTPVVVPAELQPTAASIRPAKVQDAKRDTDAMRDLAPMPVTGLSFSVSRICA